MTAARGRLFLLLILLGALALRLYWYVGPCFPDSYELAQYSYEVAHGQFDIGKEFYQSNRLGFLFPVGFMVFLFGSKPFVYTLWGLLCSLGSVVLGYGIARRLYDRQTALLTAALLAVTPLEILFWSPFLIDSVIPFYWGLCIVLFHLGLDDRASATKRRLLLLASGLVLGYAFFARLHAPVVFVFMLAYALLRGAMRRELLLVLLGFGLVFVAGHGYYYFASGDFFLREHRIWEKFGPGRATGTLEIRPGLHLTPFYIRQMVALTSVFGYVHWFTVPALVYSLLRRRTADLLPLTWFLVLYACLDFGMRSLLKQVDFYGYANILTVPATLLVARFFRGPLASVGRSAPYTGTRLAAGLGAAILVVSAAGVMARHSLLGEFESGVRTLGLWNLYEPRADRLSMLPLVACILGAAAGVYFLGQGLFARKGEGGGPARGPGLAAGCATFFVLTSLVVTDAGIQSQRETPATYRAMAEIIRKDNRPVYITSLRGPCGVNFYIEFNSNFRYYRDRWEEVRPTRPGAVVFREAPAAAAEIPAGSYVMVDKRVTTRWWQGQPAVYDVVPLPGYALDPPRNWRVLHDSAKYTLYLTGA